MVFQGVADAEKLLLFSTVVVIRNIAWGIEIMSAGLEGITVVYV
jgi:hypothetical protein